MSPFRPGETYWRVERAPRVSLLVDTQAYYEALWPALRGARRSITILGWSFDPRARLAPDGREGPNDPDEIGRILIELSRSRPELDVRLLIWKAALPISADQGFFPQRARATFAGTRVKFRLDDTVPFGACHHQKVVVIDDELAFCGGGDIVPGRWDTSRHLPEDLRRILPHWAPHPPRHEVMMMVDGDAAAALGELVRDRWLQATGELMARSLPPQQRALWPDYVRPDILEAKVHIARTLPARRSHATVDEIRKLTIHCIAEARHAILLENQYFTSMAVTDALAARLEEPGGPDIVLISGRTAPSWFDSMTMDGARARMIERLRKSDRYGRFRALSPVTLRRQPIIVHSKVSVFDDSILRVGSANLNNRSGGFDTECELGIEADSVDTRRSVTDFRNHLVSHFLDVTPAVFADALERHGRLVRAIDSLNAPGRLEPIEPRPTRALEAFLARYHIGDPFEVRDSWRPWRRSA